MPRGYSLRIGESNLPESVITLDSPRNIGDFESLWHPNYQLICEHVFNHLINVPLYIIGKKKGKDYLSLTLANRVQRLKENRFSRSYYSGFNAIVRNAISHGSVEFLSRTIKYSFLDRGSDERQYCSPGVDLPLVTLSRSKYGTYPEYHTSLDNLDFVTGEGLLGGYELIKDCINVIENNRVFRVTCYGEPQLGKRGLYPNLSTKKSGASVETMMDFIAYADGNNDLLSVSNIIRKPVREIVPIAEKLLEAGLLEEVKEERT